MKKFKNVNVIESLRAIMQQNTAFYQSDFLYDEEMIKQAANSNKREDKKLLWLSRKSGTYCFPEYKVYLKNSEAYTTWQYYNDNLNESVLAFAVEIKKIESDCVYGDIYVLDYAAHCAYVKEHAVEANTAILHYDKGKVYRQLPSNAFIEKQHPEYGVLKKYEIIPDNETDLKYALYEVRRERATRSRNALLNAYLRSL